MQPTVLILRKEHPLGLGFAGHLQVQATRQSNPRSIQYGTSKKRYSCMHITEEPKQRAARWLSPVPLCRVLPLPLIAHLLLPPWSLPIDLIIAGQFAHSAVNSFACVYCCVMVRLPAPRAAAASGNRRPLQRRRCSWPWPHILTGTVSL
jgi:hypothetical protein